MQGPLNNPALRSSQVTYITVGTACTISPLAASSTQTTDHGLFSKPHSGLLEFVNLTSDANWVPGDRIVRNLSAWDDSAANLGLVITWTATSVTMRVASTFGIRLLDKSTLGAAAFTVSKWSATLTPYYFGNP